MTIYMRLNFQMVSSFHSKGERRILNKTKTLGIESEEVKFGQKLLVSPQKLECKRVLAIINSFQNVIRNTDSNFFDSNFHNSYTINDSRHLINIIKVITKPTERWWNNQNASSKYVEYYYNINMHISRYYYNVYFVKVKVE